MPRHSRTVATILILPLLAVVVHAAFLSAGDTATKVTNGAGVPSSKVEIAGLLDRSGEPSASYLSAVGGWVVNVKWQDLQPGSQGQALPANNVIDQAIARVRALNASRSSNPLALKVRLFGGIDAPQWAKNMGGPITIHNSVDNVTGTVGAFWTPAYAAAWDALNAQLAAKYDTVPEIRDVTVSRCMTVYAEPLIREVSDPATVANLLHAGYSTSADEQCQMQQIDTAAKYWLATNSSLSFNPYQTINADGSTGTDMAFTTRLMDYCRSTLGSRCTLENNSIRSSFTTSMPLYAALAAHGPNLQFQTATAKKIGSLATTLQFALDEKAEAVELPGGYETLMSSNALAGIGNQLRSNLAVRVAPGPTPTPISSSTPTPSATPRPTTTPSSTPGPTPSPGHKVTAFAFSPSSNPTATVVSLPSDVGGVSWLFSWRDIEPNPPVGGVHTYNWSRIDAALAAAHAAGKTSMLRVTAGRESPSWVSPSVTFTYQPLGPMPQATITMPIPWSTGFVNNWTAFIQAYGARYNGDSRLYAVEMPGAGVLGEMALPNSSSPANIWTNNSPTPNGTGGDTYSDGKMIAAWNTIIDSYRTSFPSTPTGLDLGEPLNSSAVLPAVLAHAQSYGAAIHLQQNGLRAQTTSTGKYAQILSQASATTEVGWQEWGGANTATDLQASFATALATHSSYVEVYLNDCTNPANAAAFRYLVGT